MTSESPLTTSTMHFLNLPTEIRLVSELLVLDKPIAFMADWKLHNRVAVRKRPSDFRIKSYSRPGELHLAILRVNKQVNSEATPLLYSHNSLENLDIYFPFFEESSYHTVEDWENPTSTRSLSSSAKRRVWCDTFESASRG